MMLDAARRLILPSARSDVPPFMVMDVMAAAARIEAAGGHVIHMEVGQPAAPAPKAAIEAARARAARAPCVTPNRSASGRCASGSRATTSKLTGSRFRPSASSSPPVRRRVSSWRSSRCSRRAIASQSHRPGYPPYRHILIGARLRSRPDRHGGGDAVVDHRRYAGGGSRAHAAYQASWWRALPTRPAR